MQGVCTSHGVVDAKPTYRGGAIVALHCACGLECIVDLAYDDHGPFGACEEDVVDANIWNLVDYDDNEEE